MIYALLATPAGSSYIGFQFGTDDHMVYSAWMRQAMDGHLFMDNRFTTDSQPGLTIQLYFFALGLIAKGIGIPLASNLARIFFSGLFVFAAARLVRRLTTDLYTLKLALTLTVVGGGLGFMVWHTFGNLIVKPTPDALNSLMLGRLPTDVWQPEGYVFPSMLVNGLFMASLCLIVYALTCFLAARDSWKPVLPGALAIGLLMNMHSYDVLLVAMVMVGFLVTAVVRKEITTAWVGRAAVIGCGAIPAAAWFLYVLQKDAVFQARAATETYSPNFRQVFFGYFLMMLLAMLGLVARALQQRERQRRTLLGVAILSSLWLGMFVMASGHDQGYFMDMPAWCLCFLATLAGIGLLAEESIAFNLIFSWAAIGLVAMYFPALFQRKLAMGLSVPWAILAAFGVAYLLKKQERSARNLATILVVVLLGATSVRWLSRDLSLIRANVANTGRHPVYMTSNLVQVISYLNRKPGKHVVLSFPGPPLQQVRDDSNNVIPDAIAELKLPDVAPIISGFTGTYSFAGHWSETPDYPKKAGQASSFFLNAPFGGVTHVWFNQERQDFITSIGADYAIIPVMEATTSAIPFIDAASLGDVVVDGPQFRLVKLRHATQVP